MISVQNLTKRFGRTTAIDNLSFEVIRGEIVGFLGPNGAGKTTTMRILSCYMPATGGTARIAGLDVFSDSLEVRRRIGYLPENAPLYNDMRVTEYLRYRGQLRGLRGRRLRSRVGDVLDSCGLTGVRRKLISRLSKGYRQRVGLADSLIHEPEVLILDEPTIGLDPNQIKQIRELIRGLGQRHTILLSSHILPEIETVCDRVLIINNGRIMASDSPANLVGALKGNQMVLAEITGPGSDVSRGLEAIDGILKVTVSGGEKWHTFHCECDKNIDVRARIFQLVGARGWGLRELRCKKRGLEDVFVAITQKNDGRGRGSRKDGKG